MKNTYHLEITQQALHQHFCQPALEIISSANLKQDHLSGLIGHPEYHFDDNHFLEGLAYIRKQRQDVLNALANHTPEQAWQAFGRLTHGAQDFYAHSNYVQLWMDQHQQEDSQPDPEMIDPLDPMVLHSPNLISGRIYLPWEILSFIPGLEPLRRIILPADSHTVMNLDKPERGPLFDFAVAAARKRTEYEFRTICQLLRQAGGEAAVTLFTNP